MALDDGGCHLDRDPWIHGVGPPAGGLGPPPDEGLDHARVAQLDRAPRALVGAGITVAVAGGLDRHGEAVPAGDPGHHTPQVARGGTEVLDQGGDPRVGVRRLDVHHWSTVYCMGQTVQRRRDWRDLNVGAPPSGGGHGYRGSRNPPGKFRAGGVNRMGNVSREFLEGLSARRRREPPHSMPQRGGARPPYRGSDGHSDGGRPPAWQCPPMAL